MPALSRRLAAEMLGTFGLVFFGCAAIVVNAYPGAGLGLSGIALVHALTLSVMVSATMYISGGYLNPALTIGLAVARRLDAKSAVTYIVAQLIGALLAAFMVKLIYPVGVARIVAYGTPLIAGTVSLQQAIGVEALLTFFLMTAVLGTAVSPIAPRIGGFGVGLTLFFCIMVGGPLTGPSVNPARAFGPAVVSGVMTGHVVYWIGPIIGALIAAVLWDRVLLPPLAKIAEG